MGIEYRYGTDGLNWSELCEIFKKAPLGTREPDKLKQAAQGSYVVCTAYDGERAVGFGRAISDGFCQSAIYDLVLLPEYQGRGLGKELMQALLDKLPVEQGVVLVYVAPGKQSFYENLGFHNLRTGMALFSNPQIKREQGYID